MHKKMKAVFLNIFLLVAVIGYGQENIASTEKFTIEGKVKNSISFSLDQAGQYTTTTVDSIVIYNHLMQPRRTMKHIKGIVLRDIIDKAVIDIAAPKLLSEIYITCIGSDGYKVVFSWNELYNTDIGKQVLVITAADGKLASEGKDKIAIIATADKATGRRFVKGLARVLLTDIAGTNSLVVEAVQDTDALVAAVNRRYPPMTGARYTIAVDKRAISINTVISENSDLAFLPPFSGG
jgi:molybdopterin converting factor small subunit